MYTPLTPKPPRLDQQDEEKMKAEEEVEKEVEEEKTPVEDMFKALQRVLSTSSMEVPFGLLLADMPTPTDIPTPTQFPIKRQSGVRRNSKISMRLSQLRTVDTGSLRPDPGEQIRRPCVGDR
jgi:hypothetical protein